MKEVHIHPIGDKVPVTLLSTHVASSMQTYVSHYQVWVAAEKDTATSSGVIYVVATVLVQWGVCTYVSIHVYVSTGLIQ